MWKLDENFSHTLKLASLNGLYISPENSNKISYKLVRYIWFTIAFSPFPSMVSASLMEYFDFNTTNYYLFTFLQIISMINDTEPYTMEQINLTICIIGGFICIIEGLSFAANNHSFEQIISYLIPRAQTCNY